MTNPRTYRHGFVDGLMARPQTKEYPPFTIRFLSYLSGYLDGQIKRNQEAIKQAQS